MSVLLRLRWMVSVRVPVLAGTKVSDVLTPKFHLFLFVSLENDDSCIKSSSAKLNKWSLFCTCIIFTKKIRDYMK